MKLWITYIVVFFIGFACFCGLLIVSSNPEKVILGEWKEMTWEYEIADNAPSQNEIHLTDELRNQSCKNMVMHKAETWTFLPDGKLKLSTQEQSHIVDWRIKGRGHILQIKYNNDTVEHYNLSELNGNEMVLNFEVDVQVRGIAKLTFKKS